jgi:hypothetical protein
MDDEQILTDGFFQGQVATNLMRLSLQAKFNTYIGCLILNKIAEGCGTVEQGDDMKRAVLDAWHDTEISNAEAQVADAKEAQRAAGIIPLDDEVMAGPFFNLIRPMYSEFCARLKIPEENPHADG